MAQIMTKRGTADNVVTYEFVCDSLEDLNEIDKQYVTMGSVAIIISGDSGFEVYMANSQKQWVSLGASVNGGSTPSPVPTPASTEIDFTKSIIKPTILYNNSLVNYIQNNMAINNFIVTGLCDNYYSSLIFTILADLNFLKLTKTYDSEYTCIYDKTASDVYIWLYKENNTLYNINWFSDNIIDFFIDDTDKEALCLAKISQEEAAQVEEYYLAENTESMSTLINSFTSKIIQTYDLTQIEMVDDTGWEEGE